MTSWQAATSIIFLVKLEWRSKEQANIDISSMASSGGLPESKYTAPSAISGSIYLNCFKKRRSNIPFVSAFKIDTYQVISSYHLFDQQMSNIGYLCHQKK